MIFFFFLGGGGGGSKFAVTPALFCTLSFVLVSARSTPTTKQKDQREHASRAHLSGISSYI